MKLMKLTIAFSVMISCIIFNLNFSNHACAQDTEKIQIKWYIQISNDEEDPFRVGLFEAVEEYNSSQERIEVVIDPSYAGCSFDATDTLLLRIQEGNPPDITALNYSELWEHLLDLRPYLEDYDLSDVDSTFFFKHEYNNKLLHLSFCFATDLLFYNKSMFDSLDIPYPPDEYGELYNGTDVWDMDKLEDIAMLLTLDSAGHNANHPEFNPDTIIQYGYHWRYTNGLDFIKPFGQPQLVDQDCEVSVPSYSRQGYLWIKEGTWQKHFILPGEEHEALNADPLGSGRVGMVCTSSSYCDQLEDVPFEWDIAIMPEYNGNTHIAWNTGSFCILNTCEHPEEALEVIFEIIRRVDMYGTAIPTMKDLRPIVKDSLLSKFPDINWEVMYSSLEYINPDESSGDALQYNMAAWRLANSMRDYLQYDPYPDVNGALDTYFIPRWENIFADACTNDTVTKTDEIGFKTPGSAINDICNAYPTILNGHTHFVFNLPESGTVKLTVFNSNGQQIERLIDSRYPEGKHEYVWTSYDLLPGNYFLKFQFEDHIEIEKLVKIR